MDSPSPLFLEKFDACPVCASKKIAFDLVIHYWRENPLRFDRCPDCGACFANPMPSSQLISDGNTALVRREQSGRGFEQEFREARQAYLRGKLLMKRLARWKPKGRLLDLGCNNGFLLLGAKDYAQNRKLEWEVEGLEISPELADFIETKLQIRCHCGTLEDLIREGKLTSDRYDFILCHDLIEHINQPKPFLKAIQTVLRPGGRIQIITPNAVQDVAFARRAHRKGTPMTMLLNHILYFSPRALETALRSAGLRMKKLYCYDIRHALKDFGVFGMGEPRDVQPGPLLAESLALGVQSLLQEWTPEKIEELRQHPKVSGSYGFYRETLPKALTWRIPGRLGIGHEIYALAEKPQ